MLVLSHRGAPGADTRPRAPLALVLLALCTLLASCGATDRLAERRPAPRDYPRTVPADEAPLFPGLRRKSKRRTVASTPAGTRRPFTRGGSGEAVLRKRTEERPGRTSRTAERSSPSSPSAAGPFGKLSAGAKAEDTRPAATAGKREASRHERRLRADVENAAASYTGIPYKYGGTTTEGFDCSGFTQYVMRDFGIELKRVSISQAQQGRAVKPKHAKPGDLVYFRNEKGRVNHVGIVVRNDAGGLVMIHASSSRGIREDNVTHSKYWAPRLAGVRCVVECRAPAGLSGKGVAFAGE